MLPPRLQESLLCQVAQHRGCAVGVFSGRDTEVGSRGPSLRVSPRVCVPWASGRLLVSGREAGLGRGVMLAGHFVGMLAPSARAENFAAANCDFRTQVCS